MRNAVMLFAGLLIALPALAADPPASVVAKVAYLGQGQFTFKRKAYDYDGLVAALKDKYAGRQIAELSVDMGTVIVEQDKRLVCGLRQSLPGTFVSMHITVEGEQRDIFCN